nr:F-box protein At5g49610-like [Ipomoea batatas]
MGSKFYLKQEILVEILIRAKLETLDTFKVTSKESSELAGESWFIEKYARKTKNIIGYIVQTLERFTCSYNFVSINPSLEVPGGIVYLLTNHNTILAFDSTTETHTEFPSPIAAIEDDKNYSKERIVEYKGKLGFTCEYKFDVVWLWGVEDNRDYRSDWEPVDLEDGCMLSGLEELITAS